ncbi:hypothetical protein [uncultured Winogradskyella sp.]|uniref:hypothetical protein n=1 Tax=uncultured Winogradskyella sp. TaxID=395353 RepID=UPI00261DAEE0|nr:hypothetical protein [uncultured Winogradskyella sp.]
MSEEIEEQIEKPKKGIKWTTDKIMSSSALFISVISLIALLYQSYLAREENKLIQVQQSASVLPYLSQWFSYKSGSFKIIIGNKGVGPAFIKKVEMTFINQKNDTLSFNNSDHLFRTIFNNTIGLDSISYSTSTFTEGLVLPANEVQEIIALKDRNAIETFRNTIVQTDLSYRITYADVYGTEWVISGEEEIPLKLEK